MSASLWQKTRRFFGRFGTDRLAWRIALAVVLGIVGTQVVTVLVLRSLLPREFPLISAEAVIAELAERFPHRIANQADDLLIISERESGPSQQEGPDPPRTPWPIVALESELRQRLMPEQVKSVQMHPRERRRPLALIGPIFVPRGDGDRPPNSEGPGPEAGGPDGSGREPPRNIIGSASPGSLMVPAIFEIWLEDNRGHWYSVEAKAGNPALPSWLISLLWFTAIFLVIASLTLWFTAWLLRPLAALAEAARGWQAFGEPLHLPAKGPVEFRAIAVALEDMQGRIGRFMRERAELVAALSHDLRTPLTRMQLRIEGLPEGEMRSRMAADIAFMTELTQQLLAFASFDARHEAIERLDLAVLLSVLCDEASDAGGRVEYIGPPHAALSARPTALRRALSNLIDNAVKYAGGAEVSLQAMPAGVAVMVSDNGPGIPEEELQRVLAPFYRVDASRRRETGGLGMGLAIAAMVAAEHGGNLTLRNRPAGGLEARLVLPLRHMTMAAPPG